MQRFAIRYSPWLRWLFVGLGLGPKRSSVVLDEVMLRVKMGWGFRAVIPRGAIRGAEPSARSLWYGIGVHSNLRFDRWLVNGSAKGIVWIDISPKQPMRFAGIPASLRWLGLSLEDPEGFVAALGLAPPPPEAPGAGSPPAPG